MMFHRLLLAAACAVVLATSTAQAAYMDGNELKSFCDNRLVSVGNGICRGYILGVVDAVIDIQSAGLISDNFRKFCVPQERVPGGQLADIVIKYLADRPEQRHFRASVITITALRQAFPCKK